MTHTVETFEDYIQSLLKEWADTWSRTGLFIYIIERADWREIFEAFEDHGVYIDPDFSSSYERPIFNRACDMGSYEVAEYLLDLGADPDNVYDPFGESALEIVAQNRDEGAPVMLSKLLAKGAKTENKSALHRAARVCCLDSVKVLLGTNMPVNVLGEGGIFEIDKGTPLHEAAAAHFRGSEGWKPPWSPEEQEDIIEALLEAGADPESEDENGKKPAEWAVSRPGYEERGFKQLADDSSREEAFDKQKHIERIQALLTKTG